MMLTKRGREFRKARLAMEYAQEHGCTVLEAKHRILAERSRENIERIKGIKRGVDRLLSATRKNDNFATQNHDPFRDEPWMMRE